LLHWIAELKGAEKVALAKGMKTAGPAVQVSPASAERRQVTVMFSDRRR
jgi:hypothetical protein